MNEQAPLLILGQAPTDKETCSSSDETSTSSNNSSDHDELAKYNQLNFKRSGAHGNFAYGNFEDVISTVPIFTWQALLASRKLRTQYAQRSQENISQRGAQSSMPSLKSDSDAFAQYSLLGFRRNLMLDVDDDNEEPTFLNTNTPWSAFICGSQGSGKSYTLSCMLENCLYQSSRLGKLQTPLAGIVFHYDTYSGGRGEGGIAEVAHLCSLGIPVNVLVSRASQKRLSAAYMKIPGAKNNLTVSALKFRPKHLNIERMRTLMAFSDTSSVPLYMEVITMILREMAGNDSSQPVNFSAFEYHLEQRGFSKDQKGMLNLRLDLLKSFMDFSSSKSKIQENDILHTKPGSLTIIDLTDPLVDAASACSLFDICLGISLEDSQVGRVVALDEAHKYMTESVASEHFTESLLQLIRQQRHLASRIIIATQEPTISPKLLDLCTFTIVHRFSSPSWLETLRKHIAGLSSILAIKDTQTDSDPETKPDNQPDQTDNWSTETNEPHDAFPDAATAPALVSPATDSNKKGITSGSSTGNQRRTTILRPQDIFAEIVGLEAGEALLFAPTALVDISICPREQTCIDGHHGSRAADSGEDGGGGGNGTARSGTIVKPRLFGAGVFRMRTRERLSSDGGRSKMAV